MGKTFIKGHSVPNDLGGEKKLICDLDKQNKQTNKTKQKQTDRYREHTNDCQMGRQLGDRVKKGKGLTSTN